MEIDEKSGSQLASLVFGHGEGQLWALSPHPTEPMFATGSYDRNLVVWNTGTKVSPSRFSRIADLHLYHKKKENDRKISVSIDAYWGEILRSSSLLLY